MQPYSITRVSKQNDLRTPNVFNRNYYANWPMVPFDKATQGIGINSKTPSLLYKAD